MSRSSVAAVIADALARADVSRVFAAAGAERALIDAARNRGLAVVETAGATAACIMAAVTAELGDAPGVALVSLSAGLAPIVDGAAHASRDRAGIVVISDGGGDARLLEPVLKASVSVEPAAAAHWIAHAAQVGDRRSTPHVLVVLGESSTRRHVERLDGLALVRHDLARRRIDRGHPPVAVQSGLLVPARVHLVEGAREQRTVAYGPVLP